MKQTLNQREIKAIKEAIEAAQGGKRSGLLNTEDMNEVLKDFTNKLNELNKIDKQGVLNIAYKTCAPLGTVNTTLEIELNSNRELVEVKADRRNIHFYYNYLEITNFKALDDIVQKLLKRALNVTREGRINL